MSLLNDKNQIFDKLLSDYEAEFAQFSTVLKRLLSEFIMTGPHTKEEVVAFFSGTGLTEVAQGFVNKYDDVIEYTKQVSLQTGIPLVLPESSLNVLALYKENQVQNILGASESIMKAVTDASLRYGIGESKIGTIVSELNTIVDEAGRRIVTEALTGASIYDRTLKYEQFTNSGVELYFYSGPLDNVTRAVCQETLSDPRQYSGWTIEDIQSSSTPFSVCGGYNCRHEWLPMVKGTYDLVREMQREAGVAV